MTKNPTNPVAAAALNGAAMPLQIDPNMFEEHRSTVREAYCNALSGLLDDVQVSLLLPEQRATVLTDAILFTVFIGVLKIAEARGLDAGDRKTLMQIFRPLNALVERETPTNLMQFVDAKKGA